MSCATIAPGSREWREGKATLIAALADHIVKPAFVYRHQWRVGDLLMWDNCTVQHRAIPDYDLPQRRLMHRTTMGGIVSLYGMNDNRAVLCVQRARSPRAAP